VTPSSLLALGRPGVTHCSLLALGRPGVTPCSLLALGRPGVTPCSLLALGRLRKTLGLKVEFQEGLVVFVINVQSINVMLIMTEATELSL